MALTQFARKTAWCWLLTFAIPLFVQGEPGFITQGGEFGIGGTLAGDQVFPALAIKPGGGFLVWQDNRTDGDGHGISALRLDSSFSAPLSPFRVNEQGMFDQVKPAVSLLNGGGAVFVWQGGRQGFQHIYARFLSPSNTWATGDIMVNASASYFQVTPAVATLGDGTVVVVWGSFDQEGPNSLQGVYAQRFSATGQKLGGEFLVNQQYTSYNQRSPAIAPLSDGRFVVVWVNEQQRFENSVDIQAQIYSAAGAAAGSPILVNLGASVCANPSVAASGDGGFLVAWMQKDTVMKDNSWDVFQRPFSGGGFGGTVRRLNAQTYGDQYAPKVSSIGSDYLVAWTSLGQDGSREGIYAQFAQSDGSLVGGEFRVNTRTISQQMHPAVASDGIERFLAVSTSFVGGGGSFDLYAQRYATTAQPLPTPEPPFVNVLSSSSLSVTWPVLAGFSVAHYEVYADGAAPPAPATATLTDNMWTLNGLLAGSAHSFRVAFVLTDGRRSPLSGATTNTTYGQITYSGIPVEWMGYYFGDDWPLASADSDGDGASNKNEFLAGTNPTDAGSVLRIRLETTAQGLYLNWNTEPGLMYQVQSAANPVGDWTNLGGPRFAAGDVDSMYVGGSRAGFYRIVRLR